MSRLRQSKILRPSYPSTTLLQLIMFIVYFYVLQYERGRHVTERWVFGLISNEYAVPRPIFYVVDNRSRRVLLPIIRHHVLPGTTIMSDQWAAYNNVGAYNFVHQTVNHSRHFVDPATGNSCHTLYCTAQYCSCSM